jgi:hypothetical protein
VEGGTQIEYANTLKDVSVLSRVAIRDTPGGRRILLIGAVLFTAITLISDASEGKVRLTLSYFIVLLIPTALFYLLLPVISGPLSAAYYRFGRNRAVFGPHTLTLTNDGLREENPAATTVVKYDAIERILENRNYFFIFITALAAHMVPKGRITRGALDEFMTELRQRIAEAGS